MNSTPSTLWIVLSKNKRTQEIDFLGSFELESNAREALLDWRRSRRSFSCGEDPYEILLVKEVE